MPSRHSETRKCLWLKKSCLYLSTALPSRVAILAFFKPNFTILAFFNSLWLGKFEFGFFLKFGLFLAFLKVVFSFQKFHCPGVYGRNNVPF